MSTLMHKLCCSRPPPHDMNTQLALKPKGIRAAPLMSRFLPLEALLLRYSGDTFRKRVIGRIMVRPSNRTIEKVATAAVAALPLPPPTTIPVQKQTA